MNCSLDFLYYITHFAHNNINFHNHGCYELVYYISGSGYTTIHEKEYNYKQNSFTIIEANSLHDERHIKKTDVLFIGFQCYNFPMELKNGLFTDSPSKDILRILLAMKNELLNKLPYYEIKLNSFLQDLIVTLARMGSSNCMQKRDLSLILGFLKENYSQDVDYHTLAELSGYSYDRFRHIFKNEYMLSPHQYLIQLRLQNAHQMLIETQYPISHISQENGFASDSQFCSLFRKMYGRTPSKLQKEVAFRGIDNL